MKAKSLEFKREIVLQMKSFHLEKKYKLCPILEFLNATPENK